MTSMLDQYEQASQYPKATQNVSKAPPLISSGYVTMELDDDIPIFSKQKMNFEPSGDIRHIAVSNEYLVLAMANDVLFRIDLKKPDAHEEISFSKYTQNGSKLLNIFLDPLGCHLLLSLSPKSQDFSPELLYLHRKSPKIRPITKSKPYEVTEVGWNFDNASETSTGSILLGTSKGLIIETEINSEGDKLFQSGIEQYWRQVFDIGKKTNTPITGIKFFKVPNSNKYLIFVSTSERLYLFAGATNLDDKPLLQPIFNTYLNVKETGFVAFNVTFNHSRLEFFCDKKSTFPYTYGWLMGKGIHYGQVDLSNLAEPNSIIEQGKIIPFPTTNSDTNESELPTTPLSFVMTEFHALLAYQDHVRVVSLLDGKLTYEDHFQESFGNIINIVKDPTKHTIWLITAKSVLRYKMYRERRHVWQIYVEKNEFELAKKYCDNNPAYLDKIHVKQAEKLFEDGEYYKSAEIFADTQSCFEGICLKFLNAKKIDALLIYLRMKLDRLTEYDKLQTTMLVVWLVELYLSQLSEQRHSKDSTLQKEFEAFLALANVQECIKRNKSVIYDLMSSHGDKDNLIKLTIINKDFENVIRYNIYKKSYVEALGVLKSQTKKELFYQFSPILMQEIPKLTVTALIEQGKNLNPTKLLPALVSCDTDDMHVKEMIRYLEFCVISIGCTDRAIHNYLLSLYVEYDTPALMKYLESQGQTPSSVHYDVHYALRMCREKELTKACVQLSTILGLWESAVELAIKVDVELAKNIANMVDESELKKKLWLKIAEFVINSKQDIQQAMTFLQQCELIKIEDILPFFPDLVTIDHFREPICNSLQDYNQQIQYSREEMEEATHSAEQVRGDIQTFCNRSTVISVNEVCILCEITLLIRPFYLFPCGHKFHSDCLIAELQPLLGPAKKNKLDSLYRQLNSHYPDPAEDLFSGKLSSKEQLKNEIDNILASECLYCGEYMIQSIDMPFIPGSDWNRVMKEWE